MASIEDVTKIRRLTDESTAAFFDDSAMHEIIDSNDGDLRKAAAEVWEIKAARSVNLVDMSEGQSSRKLSQASAAALRMAGIYRASESPQDASGTRRATTTRPIERA